MIDASLHLVDRPIECSPEEDLVSVIVQPVAGSHLQSQVISLMSLYFACSLTLVVGIIGWQKIVWFSVN